MINELFVYLKPTNYCSVGCKHCYLTYSDRKDMYMMTEKNIEEIANKLKEYFSIYEKNKKTFIIHIEWHGGEVLTVPLEKLKKFINIFDNASTKYLIFKHTIDSSLQPLFDKNNKELDEYGKFIFENFGGFVGTSFDFFGIRKYKGKESIYLENLLRVCKYFQKKFQIEFSVNIVVNKKMINQEEYIWKWILEHKNIFPMVQFERYNEYGVELNNKSLILKNKEFSLIMVNLQNYYYEYKKTHSDLKIKILDVLENSINFLTAGDKWSGSCLTNILVINPDGSTNNCVDKSDEESFGNIYKMSIKEIFLNKKRMGWIKHQNVGHKHEDCYTCNYSRICNSGCPLIDNSDHINDECSGYINMFINTEKLLKEK